MCTPANRQPRLPAGAVWRKDVLAVPLLVFLLSAAADGEGALVRKGLSTKSSSNGAAKQFVWFIWSP